MIKPLAIELALLGQPKLRADPFSYVVFAAEFLLLTINSHCTACGLPSHGSAWAVWAEPRQATGSAVAVFSEKKKFSCKYDIAEWVWWE